MAIIFMKLILNIIVNLFIIMFILVFVISIIDRDIKNVIELGILILIYMSLKDVINAEETNN